MNFWFQVSYMYKYSGKISFIENTPFLIFLMNINQIIQNEA